MAKSFSRTDRGRRFSLTVRIVAMIASYAESGFTAAADRDEVRACRRAHARASSLSRS
jgi:hypothetical protein